ncbi:MAG: PQQ-binding-like beta-propeller repeat protein [Balneolaceae bacterium]|nr:PQQ-binding-like beta-propeller repeat protein [Balneolaceae bacterium]
MSFLLASCSGGREWDQAVPAKTPFVLMPAQDATLQSALEAPYIPFLDDVTGSAINLVGEVARLSGSDPALRAVLLYPGTGNALQPVWVAEAPGGLPDAFREHFYRDFTQNEYTFHGVRIHRLHVSERVIFAAIHRGSLLLSESSLALENMLRTYRGEQDALDLRALSAPPGSFVLNTPSLGRWAEQVARIMYRPSLLGSFRGSAPMVMRMDTAAAGDNLMLRFSASMDLTGGGGRSELVSALSTENRPLLLDRYISSDAAAFGIFRLEPPSSPPDTLSDPTPLDSALVTDPGLYPLLAQSMSPEFAMVMYAESGYESVGEHLFLRRLANPGQFRQQLQRLRDKGVIELRDGVWLASGRLLSGLIGSGLGSYDEYYLNITGEAAVISKRRGLTEVVASDRDRRRVMYYDANYTSIREGLPDEVSGLVVTGPDFSSFISSYLAPDTYIDVLTDQFDLLALSARRADDGNKLDLKVETFRTQQRTSPYEENWIKPDIGPDLSGRPVLADLGGSPRSEVIVATRSGSVMALAASDGTEVLRVNTGSDTPVGAPVVYDWYGTGQNVILLAAGNKIYGWNDTGSPLPQFPMQLDEQVTTPLMVGDVNRDGQPEAIVGTADRRLHALDGRGNNIQGWPVSTNTSMTRTPLVAEIDGEQTVAAFSENTVHAWNADGSPREGYPKFINASLTSSPVLHENHILGGGADGYLYAMGPGPFFQDSLDVYNDFGVSGQTPQAVYVSNSSLSGTPAVHTLTVRPNPEEDPVTRPVILTSSSNGSVFLLGLGGELLFTGSMGQPISQDTSPTLADVNGDGRPDIVALANFGRLYAWDTVTGERISLPTAGMEFPVLEDLNGDGYVELIARTREGLRCWTLYGD